MTILTSEAKVPDQADNTMRLGPYEFAIESSSFQHVTGGEYGPGWDFDFRARCVNDDPDEPIFPYGARLYTEVAPMPLDSVEDLTGTVLDLPLPYDNDSGEPLFGLKVWEEHDVSEMKLRFTERQGRSYRIEITALVAYSIFGHPAKLSLAAWAERLPDRPC